MSKQSFLRVLHVVPSLDAQLGGPSRMVPELTNALEEQEVMTGILTTLNSNSASSLQGKFNSVASELNAKKKNVTHYIPHRGNNSYVFSPAMKRWLQINCENYDLLHLHTVFAYPTFIASRVARHYGIPFIVTPHGMLEPWCLAYKSWKKKPYMQFVERLTLERAARVHALTHQEQDNIEKLDITNLKSFVLPNGINADDFALLPQRETFDAEFPQLRGKRIILFIGRLDIKKGIDLLIHALKQIVSQDSCLARQLQLVIAGPDLVGYQAIIKQIVQAENVGDNVVFTGMLSGKVKQAALAAAEVFVLPSRSEGFSMAVLEAMAAKLPVIITEACNFSEVAVTHSGIVIKTEVAELTCALKSVLSDNNAGRQMGERGCLLVRAKYDWRIIAAQLKEIYLDVMKPHATKFSTQTGLAKPQTL